MDFFATCTWAAAFWVVFPVSFVEVGFSAAVTSKSSAVSLEVIMVLPETSMSTVW